MKYRDRVRDRGGEILRERRKSVLTILNCV